jgi:N-acyl-D-amino-acid deacylase
MRRIPAVSLCLLALLTVVAFARGQGQPSFDMLIRNGRVMDGSGNPWLRLDIGIQDGRIAAVGRLTGATARRTIDAADRLVTPGFIDVHSHAAESMTHDALRQAQPLIAQGITTSLATTKATTRSLTPLRYSIAVFATPISLRVSVVTSSLF